MIIYSIKLKKDIPKISKKLELHLDSLDTVNSLMGFCQAAFGFQKEDWDVTEISVFNSKQVQEQLMFALDLTRKDLLDVACDIDLTSILFESMLTDLIVDSPLNSNQEIVEKIRSTNDPTLLSKGELIDYGSYVQEDRLMILIFYIDENDAINCKSLNLDFSYKRYFLILIEGYIEVLKKEISQNKVKNKDAILDELEKVFKHIAKEVLTKKQMNTDFQIEVKDSLPHMPTE